MGRPEPPAAGIVNKRWLWSALPSLLLAILAVLIRLGGTSAWDLGDGALHYLQARWAPWHAYLFFDRWAKPVYVVLGTAFAQWGPAGMVVFDALLAAATAITILTLIGPDRKRAAWLVPIMLFGSIQYFKVVVSGLTEPLFGLASVLAVLLLFRRRYTAAMALLSFTPFIRPEYVVLAPMLVLWTAYKRQWKALPWLALGPVLYMLAGRAMLGERFLNFARDPYEDNTLYPPGGWDNFLVQAADILGEPLLILFLLCLPVMALLWSKDRTRRPAYQAIMVLVLAPVVGIWAIHSYAYWAGGHGSAGLLRVLATATPLTVLFVAYTLFHAARHWEIKRPALLFGLFTLGYFAWAQDDLRYRLPLPARPTTEQLMVEAAMKDAMAQIGPGGRIATAHPYSAVLVGHDPWAPDHAGSDYLDLATLELGDILEWNSEYATQRPDLAGFPAAG